ncbi:ABC transporter ATP-binding protein [Streptomyces sp. NPDC051776]|uniref:ABC transporter ATP-binding protein n=1 Tax=Streptomyces sp. NPDC051776 TaxID=3155414 RepID=UPI0034380AC5
MTHQAPESITVHRVELAGAESPEQSPPAGSDKRGNVSGRPADPSAGSPRASTGGTAPPPLRRILQRVRRPLALAVGLQAVATVCGIVPLIAVAEIAARLTGDAAPSDDRVRPLVVLASLGALVSLACGYAAGVVAHLADNRMQLALRRELAEQAGRLPLGRITANGSSRIKSAVKEDVRALHALVAHTVPDVTTLVTAPVLALTYLFAADWRMALVSVGPLLLGGFLFGRAMSGAMTQMQEYGSALSRISSAAVEFACGITVVKAFGRERSAHARFLASAEAFSGFFRRWVRTTLATSTAALLVVSPVAVVVLLVVVGAALVGSGSMPAADLVPFVLLGPVVSTPMGVVGTRIQQIQAGHAAAARICALLDAPVLAEPTAPATPDGARISMRGVSFSYDGRTDALTGIDLDLEPGTVTALVGPSGSGKSTLAALLPRFHDVTAGSVSVGGADVRDIRAADLYRRVGFVLQDVRLLRATVADNIRLGRPEATDEDVVRAARSARIHDRIATLPQGYDTVIGVDAQLSAGEGQRLSIARALLADTPVLVLDEATAFADPHSEAQLQDALSALTSGRTMLVIAHRLASIRSADLIAVLEHGRIVERGRHEELLAAKGRYARMWQSQQTVTQAAAVPPPAEGLPGADSSEDHREDTTR